MRIAVVSCLGVSICCLVDVARAQLTWTQFPGGPPARHAAGAVMGFGNNDVLLFGGAGTNGVLGDTWLYTGVWSQLASAVAPSARSHVAMTVDNSGVVYLFGGRDGSGAVLADTWVHANGSTPDWLVGPGGPPARDSAVLSPRAWYSALVLFGGRNGAQVLGDTWLLEPTATPAWTQVATPATPSARHGHAMVGVATQVLLFGGLDAAGNHLDDTWVLEQATSTAQPVWIQLFPPVRPSPRSGHAMRFSPHRGRVQLVGGEGPGGLLGDTWEWDGTTWTQIPAVTPPNARAGAVLVDEPYHTAPALRNGLLIGGRDTNGALAEVWEVKSTVPAITWSFGAHVPFSPSMLASEGWLGGAINVQIDPYPQAGVNPLAHLIVGFSNTTSPFGPLPLDLGPLFNHATLLVDPVLLVPFPPPASFGAPRELSIPLPANTALAGVHLFVQGVTFQQVPTGGPWLFSRGYQCQIGWL